MKMKIASCLYLLLVLGLTLFSCTPAGSTTSIPPTKDTYLPPQAFLSPTFTFSPQLTPTVTIILPATLEPKQAKETILTLLREPMDCDIPCFWGIIPGRTTFKEVMMTFAHLGLQLKYNTTLGNKEYYELNYAVDSGLRVSPLLAIENNVVKNITVYITPEAQRAGIPREWSAYSPETLIKQYGPPSRVDFFLGEIGPPTYSMQVYFKEVDLIIQYINIDHVVFESGQAYVCPLLDQYNSVRVWLGENPQSPPGAAVPLEEATSMTLDEFASLMMGNPDQACFDLKKETFP